MSGIQARVATHEPLDVLLMPTSMIDDYIKAGIVLAGGRTPLANIGLGVGVTVRRQSSRHLDVRSAARSAEIRARGGACAADGHAERGAERQGHPANSALPGR